MVERPQRRFRSRPVFCSLPDTCGFPAETPIAVTGIAFAVTLVNVIAQAINLSRLKVLLVDSDIERTAALRQRLRDISDATIVSAVVGSALIDVVTAEAPDLIIVDMGRPDRDALDDLRRVGVDNARPIVIFVDRDDRAFMEEAIAAGVSSYNVVGSAFPDVKPIVMAAVAIFRRFQKTADDLKKAQTALVERETINRAKLLLMKKRGIDEPRAYGWLRKRAMDGNRRIADIAAELLAAAEREETPK